MTISEIYEMWNIIIKRLKAKKHFYFFFFKKIQRICHTKEVWHITEAIVLVILRITIPSCGDGAPHRG